MRKGDCEFSIAVPLRVDVIVLYNVCFETQLIFAAVLPAATVPYDELNVRVHTISRRHGEVESAEDLYLNEVTGEIPR